MMQSALLRNVLCRTALFRSRQSLICSGSLVKQNTFVSSKCYNSTLIGHDYIVRSPYEDINIPETNVCHHILDSCKEFSNLTALVDGVTGKTWTYDQLKDDVVKVGSALTKQGFKKGDVITIFSPNCPEYAIMYLAVTGIGGVVSAVNPVYTSGELQHAVSHSGSKLLITAPGLVPTAKEAAAKCPNLKEIIVFGESEGCRPFSNLMNDDGKSFPDNFDSNAKQDMAALPYSSGTTGLPKGVKLSHYNIVSNVEQMVQSEHVMNYTPGADVFLGVLPFFHIYGQVVVLLCGLKTGAKIVTVPKFDPEQYLGLAEKHRATFLHVVPPIVLFLAKHPMVSKYDLSSVHSAFTGAAPVGKETVKQAVDRIGIQSFRQGYGLTEASPVTHMNPVKGHKYHTIGCAVHNVQYKIVDIETNETLGPGQEGELCVRGPNIMLGYYKNDEATKNTIKDGWLHTGDIGYYEDDTHVTISDRLKELIKVKGFQVAPAELEALLVTHPKIQDAAVIGKPDERAGELPRAYVVLKAGEEASEQEIKEFVKGKVAPFKELEGGVEIRNEIPKSASGKIMRRYLKDELKEAAK